MAHDIYIIWYARTEEFDFVDAVTTTVATTTATSIASRTLTKTAATTAIQRSQSYCYTSRRHSLIRYCVHGFQISQLIRLLIRDKQTNPFKYQTVLIGASRTYGSEFGFSLNANTNHVVFRALVCVCEHISLQTCLRWLRKPRTNTCTTNPHQPTNQIRLQHEQLKRLISFIPFFHVRFSDSFLLPVFRLLLVLLGLVSLCYCACLLFSYCSLKYYMPLWVIVVVVVVVVFKTCVHTVSQFLSEEKKKTHSHTHTHIHRKRSE